MHVLAGLAIFLVQPLMASYASTVLHERVATFPAFTYFECWLLEAFIFTIAFVPLTLVFLSSQATEKKEKSL